MLLGLLFASRLAAATGSLFDRTPSGEMNDLVTGALRADAREDWSAALGLYARAAAVLIDGEDRSSTPARRLTLDKLDQERRASLRLLELCGGGRPCAATEGGPLEAGRLLRRKVVLIANRGEPLPLAVAEHARFLLRRVAEISEREKEHGLAAETAALERCALEAAVGDRTRARHVLATVPRASRALPALAPSMAACRAALGENQEAVRLLLTAFGELPPPSDEGSALGNAWRDVYLLDDWQALRGDPAFERLFAAGAAGPAVWNPDAAVRSPGDDGAGNGGNGG